LARARPRIHLARWHVQHACDPSEQPGRFPAGQPSSLLLTRMRSLSLRSWAIASIPVACLAVLVSCGGEPTTPVLPPPVQPETPVTGAAVEGMGAFDQSVPALMKKYGIPGGAVAVVHNGKLFYARGFGYVDVEHKVPVAPDALFRSASVSKPITSAAIMKLVEEGKLALDDRVAPLIA